MSSSEDSTRPISVAELLARNGTIGSPPVGGHRRRRRRKSDSVSVAELTGEIPVIRDQEPEPAPEEPAGEEPAGAEPAGEETVVEQPVVEEAAVVETVAEEPAADEAAAEQPVFEEPAAEEPVSGEPVAEASGPEEAVVEEEAVAEEGPVAEEEPVVAEAAAEEAQPDEVEEIAQDGTAESVTETAEAVIHEALAEDVVIEDVVIEDVVIEDVVADEVVNEEPATEEPVTEEAVAVEPAPAPRAVESSPPLSSAPRPSRRSGPERSYDPRPARRAPSGAEQMAPDPVDQSVDLAELVDEHGQDAEELRSYLRASGGTLFSGETVADERARLSQVTDVIEPVEAAAPVARRGALSLIWHGVVAVLQSLLAVVFGAGLFIAFDQLWRWNNIVALVLSVLVILGLVVAVRLVRKTEDITSTLIAVAVGALVTLGPLALLQST